MTFAVFAKTHYPLKHSSKPRSRPFDISKDLKPGMRIYYSERWNNNNHRYGTFVRYECTADVPIKVWANWDGDSIIASGTGWMYPEDVHLSKGETLNLGVTL